MATRLPYSVNQIAPIRDNIGDGDDRFPDEGNPAWRTFIDGDNSWFEDWRGNRTLLHSSVGGYLDPAYEARIQRQFIDLVTRAERTYSEHVNQQGNNNGGNTGGGNDNGDDDDDDGGGSVGVAGGGGSGNSQSATNDLIAAQSENGGGYPTADQTADAINGLPITDFTDELLALIDPSTVISFEQLPSGQLVNARVEKGRTGRELNFITAMFISIEYNALIARSTWADESGVICRWIAYVKGAFYLFTADERRVLRNDDLAEDDIRATNWRTSNDCFYEFDVYPKIGGESQAEKPTFDIKNPPCSISEVS